jgi:hypothetical protein
MPSWRLHLLVGTGIAVILIYACYYLDLHEAFFFGGQFQYFFLMQIWFVSLLGSLLPDYDYRRTMIRHSLGIILGVFIAFSIVYINRAEPGNIDPGFVIILVIMVAFTIFIFGLVAPLKHHGKLHSISAALVYSGLWMCLELFIFELTLIQTGLVGMFAFCGYFFHLVLDRDMKFY